MEIRHSLAKSWLLTIAVASGGCAGGPRSFQKIESNTPLVRARAVGLGDKQPNSQVIPALVGHLDDSDPVVRLAANEELIRRTGNDFGFVPWDDPQTRKTAVDRWKAWITQGMPRTFGRPAAEPSAQSTAAPSGPMSASQTTPPPQLNRPVAPY